MAAELERVLDGGKAPSGSGAAPETPLKRPAAATPAKTGGKASKKIVAKKPAAAAVKGALPFPGVPKTSAKIAAMRFKDFKIYTAVNASGWRVLRDGQRVDKKFSWKQNPRQAWDALLSHVGAK